jgi:hypothetical protein
MGKQHCSREFGRGCASCAGEHLPDGSEFKTVSRGYPGALKRANRDVSFALRLPAEPRPSCDQKLSFCWRRGKLQTRQNGHSLVPPEGWGYRSRLPRPNYQGMRIDQQSQAGCEYSSLRVLGHHCAKSARQFRQSVRLGKNPKPSLIGAAPRRLGIATSQQYREV